MKNARGRPENGNGGDGPLSSARAPRKGDKGGVRVKDPAAFTRFLQPWGSMAVTPAAPTSAFSTLQQPGAPGGLLLHASSSSSPPVYPKAL